MRIFLGLAAAAAAALVVAGWQAPVAAQSTPAADNPHNLPSIHFDSDGPLAGHGFDIPPGFAHV